MHKNQRKAMLAKALWHLQRRHLERETLIVVLWRHRLRRHPDRLIPHRVVKWMRSLPPPRPR